MIRKTLLMILLLTATLFSAGLTGLNIAQPVTVGKASWYGHREQGKRTASGERFNSNGFTCASRAFPLGTWLVVRYPRTKLQVVVRVNDRGPWVKGRIIDLSERAAKDIGLKPYGVDTVQIEEYRLDFKGGL